MQPSIIAVAATHWGASARDLRAARKAVRVQAGIVNHDLERAEASGRPLAAWPAQMMRDRRELYAAMAQAALHLSTCRGNGRTCACRVLSLGLLAFSKRGLVWKQARDRLVSNTLFGLFLGVLYWWAFTRFADSGVRAARLNTPMANLSAGLLIGVAGGVVVAGLQTVYAVLTTTMDAATGYMTTVGADPDTGFRLLALMIGPWRRKIRRRRLTREFAALRELRQWEEREWAVAHRRPPVLRHAGPVRSAAATR